MSPSSLEYPSFIVIVLITFLPTVTKCLTETATYRERKHAGSQFHRLQSVPSRKGKRLQKPSPSNLLVCSQWGSFPADRKQKACAGSYNCQDSQPRGLSIPKALIPKGQTAPSARDSMSNRQMNLWETSHFWSITVSEQQFIKFSRIDIHVTKHYIWTYKCIHRLIFREMVSRFLINPCTALPIHIQCSGLLSGYHQLKLGFWILGIYSFLAVQRKVDWAWCLWGF